MKRSAKRLAVALLIVSLYIVVLPDPTGKEFTLTALWATVPELAPVIPGGSGPDPSSLIAVDAGTAFAYLGEDGDVAYRGRTAYRVAMSRRGFINYSQGAEQLVSQNVRGEFIASLPVAGYPTFVGDRLFVVSEAGGMISEWTIEGAELWRRSLVAPVVSLAAGDDYAALGLAAGGPLLLSRDGSVVELQRPSTGSESLVYTVELSESPDRVAVIAAAPLGEARLDGADGKAAATLTLYDFDSGRGIPVVRRAIVRDSQTGPVVKLVEGGSVLRYSDIRDEHVLVSLTIETGDESVLPLSLPPVEVVEVAIPGLQAVLAVGNERDPSRGFAVPAELLISTTDSVVPVRTSWAGDSSTVAQLGSITTVQIDDRVLAFVVGTE